MNTVFVGVAVCTMGVLVGWNGVGNGVGVDVGMNVGVAVGVSVGVAVGVGVEQSATLTVADADATDAPSVDAFDENPTEFVIIAPQNGAVAVTRTARL